jgi:hypothetical protein
VGTVVIVLRPLLVLAVIAALVGCSGAPAASTSPAATAQPSVVITIEMVRLTETTILQGLDAAMEQGLQSCKARVQQGGDTSSCDAGRNASLVARKALTECFARADQAPTPAESISAIMVCQQRMPQ